MVLCGRQPTELGHICATADLRLQLSTTQIEQFTAIFFDTYTIATGPVPIDGSTALPTDSFTATTRNALRTKRLGK